MVNLQILRTHCQKLLFSRTQKSIFHRLGIKAISWWVAGQVPTNRGLWHFAYVELKAFEK